MHNDAAAAQKEVSRPPSKLSLNRGGSGKPLASPQRPPSLSGHTASPASGLSSAAQVPLASSSSSGPQFKLKGASTSSTISFTRIGSTAARASTSAKATNWTEDMQTQEGSSQGPLASQFDLGASQLLSTQARDSASTMAHPPRKIDPLDEESDSSEESSDDDDDSDCSEEEGIEVISAEDSSDEEDPRRVQTERLQAQAATLLAAPAVLSKPATPEKGGTASASHSPIKDETASGASTPAKELPVPTGPGMDLCCIASCTKVHSNHVYNEAVGRMREPPNSQRMCRAHYIQGLGQCCVKDCTNKATNRNLKKGAKLPIKEGLHDQLHKVCMEHWNLVDQQTKSNEGKKKGKRKKKDTKTKGKKRRRNSGDAEVEAFLASELGGKASGESDSGYSDDGSEAEIDVRRSSPNDFYAVQKSTTEARGEKRDRVASTLSEEDASSDSDRESAKRRRTFREDNGRPLKSAAVIRAKPVPVTPSRAGVPGVDRTEVSLGEPKAKETKGATPEVQLLRGEVAQLRNELKELKQFMKSAMAEQLSALRTECTGLISAKLTEAHEREMVQLRLIHQAAGGRQVRPASGSTGASNASRGERPS